MNKFENLLIMCAQHIVNFPKTSVDNHWTSECVRFINDNSKLPCMEKVKVLNKEISIHSQKEGDYISLTDIARYKNPEHTADVVKNWTRSKDTIEFLGLWERINNPEFKLVESNQFRTLAGSNSFVLSPQKWIETTNAIGIISKSGRSGGTFAHKDIAFEFAAWISAEFKLFLIKEFQRLQAEENKRKQLGWDIKRNLAKIAIHQMKLLVENRAVKKLEL